MRAEARDRLCARLPRVCSTTARRSAFSTALVSRICSHGNRVRPKRSRVGGLHPRLPPWIVLRRRRRECRGEGTPVVPATIAPHAQSPKLASCHRTFCHHPERIKCPRPHNPFRRVRSLHDRERGSPNDRVQISWPERGVLNAVSISSLHTNPATTPALSSWNGAPNRLTFLGLIWIIVQRCHSESRMS